MSAPIAINLTQSASRTSTSTSPSSPGLYVPIHKRAGSNTSSSSRPSSPSSTLSSVDTPPPHMYSVATLLSLQPFADESMKGKMLATCPDVVMTRKMRKGLEFNGRRTEVLAAQQLHMQASAAPALDTTATETNAIATLQGSTPGPLRVTPRRSRPVGRAPERRRNVFSAQNQVGLKFGTRRGLSTGNDSWRLQPMPLSPVLLV